jgi:hypothetical protein
MGHPNIYSDVSEFIKHRRYTVKVPSYTAKISPYYFQEDDRGVSIVPNENSTSPTYKCIANLSIGEMINYREQNIPIVISNKLDLVDIYLHLDDYMTKLKQYNTSDTALRYLVKAERFLREIYDRLRALAFDDPGLKHHVDALKNKLDELFVFLKTVTIEETNDDS